MVLTLAQIQTVLASNALFARKFDVQIKESPALARYYRSSACVFTTRSQSRLLVT